MNCKHKLINKSRKIGIVLLVRHAESEHTRADGKIFFAGSKHDTGITKKGALETKSLARRIVEEVKFVDFILCSPLKRSKQTAEIIKNQIKILSQSDPKIIELENMIEVNVGKFSGKTSREVKKRFPIRSHKFYNNHIKDWDFPEGEDYGSIAERIGVVIKKIISHINDGKNVVIVSHGMISRVMLYLLDSEKPYWGESDFLHDFIYKIIKENNKLRVEKV